MPVTLTRKLVKTFDAGFDRQGSIAIELAECLLCQVECYCMVTDNSEYVTMAVCEVCWDREFREFWDTKLETVGK
jgi:hypothetical protein